MINRREIISGAILSIIGSNPILAESQLIIYQAFNTHKNRKTTHIVSSHELERDLYEMHGFTIEDIIWLRIISRDWHTITWKNKHGNFVLTPKFEEGYFRGSDKLFIGFDIILSDKLDIEPMDVVYQKECIEKEKLLGFFKVIRT